MASRYKQPEQCGRGSAHKSWAATAPSSLGDYMYIVKQSLKIKLELTEKSAYTIRVFKYICHVLVYNAFSAQERTAVKPAVANFAADFIHQEFSWQCCFVVIRLFGHKGIPAPVKISFSFILSCVFYFLLFLGYPALWLTLTKSREPKA
jgi:hypothetical protein